MDTIQSQSTKWCKNFDNFEDFLKSKKLLEIYYFDGYNNFTKNLMLKFDENINLIYLLEGHSKIGKTTQVLKIYYDRCRGAKPTIYIALKEKKG